MSNIRFYFHNIPESFLKERRRLKAFIEQLFEKKKIELTSLTCVFCSDEYLLNINREFLNHNFYTDIITFNLASSPKLIEGEVYISIDRVRENAKKGGFSFNEEIHRVIIHGILHLCGYADKTKEEKKIMRALENKFLKLYFS